MAQVSLEDEPLPEMPRPVGGYPIEKARGVMESNAAVRKRARAALVGLGFTPDELAVVLRRPGCACRPPDVRRSLRRDRQETA